MMKLTQFARRKYLNLETYRQDGSPVRTPLLFVERDGRLYMRTPAKSYKVKRLRRNRRVRVVPCDFRGGPQGEWVEGEARIIPTAEAQWVNDVARRKYGLPKYVLDLRTWITGREYVVLEIQVW